MSALAHPADLPAEKSDLNENRYAWFLTLGLCLIVLVGAVAPRSLAFLPSVLGVAAYIYYRMIYKAWGAVNKPALIMTSSLCVLGLVSSLWAVDPGEAFERSYKTALILLPCCLLLSAAFHTKEALMPRLALIMPWLLMAILGLNLIELLSEGYIQSIIDGVERESINMASYNRGVVFAVFLVFPVMAYCLGSNFYNARSKILLLGFGALLLAGIFIVTDSQSAQLAFAGGFLFFMLHRFMKPWIWKLLSIILIALVIASPWIAVWMFNTLPEMLGEYTWFQRAYAMHRMEIWDFISRYALQQPLYGYGMEATEAIKNFDTQMLYFRYPVVLHPHNFALQFWIEFGVIGIMAASAIIYCLLKTIQQCPAPLSRLSLGAFFAILCVASTGYGIWQGWFLGTVMTIVVLCSVLTIPQDHES